MNNPWKDLPNNPPYLLEIDQEAVLKYNSKLNESHNHWIHTELLPEPYLGTPNAPLVLLTGNPGYHEDDIKYHQTSKFQKISRDNLLHNPTEYPLYLLNPEIFDAPGCKYWRQKLKPLVKKYGEKKVANKVFILEYHGYHSKKFKTFRKNCKLPSQEYSFELLRRAIVNNAIVVAMRNIKNWLESVAQLEGYRNYYSVNSVQNPAISSNNLKRGYFEITKVLE